MQFDAREVYRRVVELANLFVEERSFLTIQALNDFDPSVEELAKTVRSIAEIIQILSNDFSDENMAINALQCSIELHSLAMAAKNRDQEGVDRALDSLEKYGKGPY